MCRKERCTGSFAHRQKSLEPVDEKQNSIVIVVLLFNGLNCKNWRE